MSLTLDLPGFLRITCAPAVAPYLAGELAALGFKAPTPTERDTWVDIEGTLIDAMRLNLQLRTAYAVLFLLAEFRCNDLDQLFERTNGIPWEEFVPADGYLTVASRVNNPSVTNWNIANLRVKDAIVDRIAEKAGRRPDSGPDRSGVVVQVYWVGTVCRLYLNASGNKLADRGYRRMPHLAPMQETLAAAVLMAAEYTGEQPLVNPMCGSGTLAIEAALMASGRAPGLLRTDFGLSHTTLHNEETWQSVRREVSRRAATPPGRIPPIIATDIDPKAIGAAKQNAKTAGVDNLIQFAVCDFTETKIPETPGIVLLNPEYGERLGEIATLEKTYDRIGDFFKKQCASWTGYVFTGNKDLAKKIRLTASRRIPFWNAKIECRLLKYEMYQGTRRKQKEEP